MGKSNFLSVDNVDKYTTHILSSILRNHCVVLRIE